MNYQVQINSAADLFKLSNLTKICKLQERRAEDELARIADQINSISEEDMYQYLLTHDLDPKVLKVLVLLSGNIISEEFSRLNS